MASGVLAAHSAVGIFSVLLWALDDCPWLGDTPRWPKNIPTWTHEQLAALHECCEAAAKRSHAALQEAADERKRRARGGEHRDASQQESTR
jgi:hypothetical protein